MSRFLSKRFLDLEAYTPGEQPRDQQYIKLNTNESPYPPAPLVFERIGQAEIANLNLYPDPQGRGLKDKLAALYGVGTENIFLSNGSDEILNFAFMAFCDGENGAIFPQISYGFYQVYGDLYGIPYTEVPLQSDFTIDPADYDNAQKMVVIANPNAPTGIALSLEDIERVIEKNPESLVLIDEAYVDFGGESCVGLVEKYSNLLVCMTFSKSRSMAGARLGFAIGQKEIIADLEKIKFSTNPYNINSLTLAAGEAAIESNDYYVEKADIIIATRERVRVELEALGAVVLPSKTNFLFVSHPEVTGAYLYQGLRAQGILVRHFPKAPIENFIRVTIGTPGNMTTFLETITELLKTREA